MADRGWHFGLGPVVGGAHRGVRPGLCRPRKVARRRPPCRLRESEPLRPCVGGGSSLQRHHDRQQRFHRFELRALPGDSSLRHGYGMGLADRVVTRLRPSTCRRLSFCHGDVACNRADRRRDGRVDPRSGSRGCDECPLRWGGCDRGQLRPRARSRRGDLATVPGEGRRIRDRHHGQRDLWWRGVIGVRLLGALGLVGHPTGGTTGRSDAGGHLRRRFHLGQRGSFRRTTRQGIQGALRQPDHRNLTVGGGRHRRGRDGDDSIGDKPSLQPGQVHLHPPPGGGEDRARIGKRKRRHSRDDLRVELRLGDGCALRRHRCGLLALGPRHDRGSRAGLCSRCGSRECDSGQRIRLFCRDRQRPNTATSSRRRVTGSRPQTVGSSASVPPSSQARWEEGT